MRESLQEWKAWYLGSAPSHPGFLPGMSSVAQGRTGLLEVVRAGISIAAVVVRMVVVVGQRGSLLPGTQGGGVDGVVEGAGEGGGQRGSFDPGVQIGGGD